MIFGLRFALSLTSVEARRQWNNIYNILGGNPYLSRVVSHKKYFKHEGEKKIFSGYQKNWVCHHQVYFRQKESDFWDEIIKLNINKLNVVNKRQNIIQMDF